MIQHIFLFDFASISFSLPVQGDAFLVISCRLGEARKNFGVLRYGESNHPAGRCLLI